MAIDWGDYEIYDPGTYGPLQELPRAEAKAAFDRLMAARPERIAQLGALLERNGLSLGSSDADIQALDEWLCANVEPDPDEEYRVLPDWYSVVNDIAIHLGEVAIERHPQLHWEFAKGGKKALSFQRHVLAGFTNVKDKTYNVDVDYRVAAHAECIAAGDEDEPRDDFVKMMGVIAEYA